MAGVSEAAASAPAPPRGRGRDVALLATAMAMLYVMVQVYAGAGPATLIAVTGVRPLAGMAPALIFGVSSIAALTAGRAMDRWGRVPVIAAGFALGACGAALTGAGLWQDSAALVVLGFIVVGGANGTAFMCRVAAADLYPPERRARAMGSVMMGAVAGALLGPLVLMPLVGRGLHRDTLATAWLVAGGAMIAGCFIVTRVRSGRASAGAPGAQPRRGLARALLRRPGAARALLAAASSLGVMVAAMSLIGHAMTGMGHHGEDVFPVLSAHFIGMFAFMIPVGIAVDRIGHVRGMILGLIVLGASVGSLAALESARAIAIALFGIGLGWNVAFVGATTRLAALTDASERGTLFGVNDAVSGLSAALLALGGGAVLPRFGLPGLALALTAIVAIAVSVVALAREAALTSSREEASRV